MRTTFVSTPTLMNTPRTGVARMQAEITRLGTEVTTGRIADAGLDFGAATGRDVTLHVDLDTLSATLTSLGGATNRLDQTQAALGQMAQNANTFLDDILAGGPAETIQQGAQSALSAFVSNANASDGHTYFFGGINSAVAPVADYDAGPKAAIDAAFLAKFGITQDDPAVANISASDMSDFLDNEFAAIFSDPSWGATWSQASDQTMSTRTGSSETLQTSVSANTPAMRKLAMVYTMVGELGLSGLGAEAQKVVLDKAASVAGDAISDLTDVQAAVGNTQNRLKDATQRLTLQQDITQRRIQALEGVDPAEAKVHIDTLSTQIEMSYSLTTKLLQMSLLNYV